MGFRCMDREVMIEPLTCATWPWVRRRGGWGVGNREAGHMERACGAGREVAVEPPTWPWVRRHGWMQRGGQQTKRGVGRGAWGTWHGVWGGSYWLGAGRWAAVRGACNVAHGARADWGQPRCATWRVVRAWLSAGRWLGSFVRPPPWARDAHGNGGQRRQTALYARNGL